LSPQRSDRPEPKQKLSLSLHCCPLYLPS
jgi:hypothetical protein